MAELSEQTFRVTRGDLIRYAGASGDFNPIHYSARVAASVGLPGVIAHGMYTLGVAASALQAWLPELAPAGSVVELGAKFTRPVVVPDDDRGAELVVRGRAGDPDEHGRIAVAMEVTCGGVRVLGVPRAVVVVAADRD